MGISEHLSMEELGNTKTHLMSGQGDELKGVAVDVLACGPLTIIKAPDHPEDEHRDQQAFFMRAQMLDGTEHELMFHIEQVGLIHEMTSDVMHNHMLQALKILDAPQGIRDDYDTTMKRDKENMEVRHGIIAAAEAAMMTKDIDTISDEDASSILDHLMQNPKVREILESLMDDEDDES